MRHLPVHWTEGMFMRPQHFQAADRFWSEQLQTSTQWDHQYGYGLRDLEFSRDAMANHQLQLHRLQARMKDGTLVALDVGQEPDRVDLKGSLTQLDDALIDLTEAFARESTVRVYLAVPRLQLGQANVARLGMTNGQSRYATLEQQLQDESDGGNDQPIELKRLQVRLLLSTEDLSGYELLPILQIQRASEGEAVPRLDPDYIPPLLACDAWGGLSRDIIRAIYDIIGKRIETLSQQVLSRGMSLDSKEPGDMERILMLNQLNQAATVLHVMTFAVGIHPLEAYTELARIVGMLSIFHPDRRAIEIPRYDHDDLGRIFKYLKERIEFLINILPDYQYEQRFFSGVERGMQVTLEPKWLTADWGLLVGVHKGDLTEEELRRLLQPVNLDWKLGSGPQVEEIFRLHQLGLQLTYDVAPPRALPRSSDWVYFKISRNDPYWSQAVASKTLGLRLKQEAILNLANLPGQKAMKLNAFGRPAELQFALFAVPLRQ